MKKSLIILLTTILLGAGGAFYYFSWKPGRVDLWTFVPNTSIAVFQPVDLNQLIMGEEGRKVLKNLKALPEFDQLVHNFSLLDSIKLKTDATGNLFEQSRILISFHKSDKSARSLSNLYLIEVKNLKLHSYFSEVVALIEKQGFKKSERLYQGYTINEFSKGKITLAYIFYNNFLITSFSPFLVDDAIRMLEKGRENEFVKNADLFSSTKQKLVGEGRLYINIEHTSKLTRRILENRSMNLSALEWFSQLMYLDVSVTNDKIDFSGFSILDTAQMNYLSAYQSVRGVGFEMKNVIPDHSSLVLHVSFDDTKEWHDGLKVYWRKHKPSQLTAVGELENKYGFDKSSFYKLVKHEVGMFMFDTKRSFIREKIVCIKHEDHILAEKVFNDLAKSVGSDNGDNSDTYMGRRVGFINIEEVPARLFGDIFQGFPEVYYFVNQGYIFLANSQHALHTLIDDIDAENTWRKSIKTNKFLETTNDDANFSVYAKGTGFWQMVGENLIPEWGEYLKEHEVVFSQIEYAAAQFIKVDDNFYTNITFQHPGKLLKKQEPKSLQTKRFLNFDQSVISKPFGVRNHKNRTLEMMVQDSSFNIHLVNSNNQKVLKVPLKGRLATPVYQIDYYKNGKLQYLFALKHSIHIIDRTGTYIPGYPISVKSDQPIKYISLIDYDGSKDYRFLAATEKSFYYMYNKAGKKLKGWNPKKLTGSPMMPGTHLRVRNADYMMFLQDNGIVHGLNRQGIGKKGFPIDLKGNVSSPLHIQKGGTLASSELVVVTDNGELIEFNLLGRVIRREQFLKESVKEKFNLINSNNGEKFVVTKQSTNRLHFHNENLEVLFDVPLNSSSYGVQYYSFDTHNEVIVLIDKLNELTYLYNMEGMMLHVEPLETGNRIAMLHHDNGDYYEIYCTTGNQLRTVTIRR
ncbi:MAG: hypothetical protein JXR07_03160 [Reichenbachiella sp.]